MEVRVSLLHPAVEDPLGVEDVEAAVLWDWYAGERLADDDEAWLLRAAVHRICAERAGRGCTGRGGGGRRRRGR